MPLPKPNSGETQNAFTGRCMGDSTMLTDYPNQAQRMAVCSSQWRRRVQANADSGPLVHYGVKGQPYTIREEMHMGRKHLILPVIMLKEGVHAGSHGPLLHLADEMGRFPGAWDGIPISVQHPVMDGYNVSCNSPDVIDSQAVGRVYHTQMDGGRLRAEAYIDLEAITRISPEALRYIRQGLPLDVSVGVFTDDEQVTGDWMGEAYQAIARGHRPDHLALLPGGVGACSWRDGCGVRTNEKGGAMADISDVKVSLEDVFKGLQPGDYRLKEDGSVEAIEDLNITQKEGVKIMGKENENEKGKPCCPEKVELLIQSGAFGEQEREWLLGLTVNDMAKVQASLDSCTTKMAAMQAKMDKMMGANAKEKPPQMNQEQAIQVLKDQFSDPDKALALFPQEIQENLRHGLNLYRAQRTEMIKKITTNTDVYTADELAPLSMEALDKLARAILPKTDFTPLGGGNGNVAAYADEGNEMLPPGVV